MCVGYLGREVGLGGIELFKTVPYADVCVCVLACGSTVLLRGVS